MGALYESKCYLSSPIERDSFINNWRPDVINQLTDRFGIQVHDPSQDIKQHLVGELNQATEDENYDEVERIATLFTKGDLSKIDRCDFLIAAVFKDIPSVGVPCEVVHAIGIKKPVMIVSLPTKQACPKWYFGNMRHRYIFGSWNELFDYLQEVDEFKHRDNHRWWYTYGMI